MMQARRQGKNRESLRYSNQNMEQVKSTLESRTHEREEKLLLIGVDLNAKIEKEDNTEIVRLGIRLQRKSKSKKKLIV